MKVSIISVGTRMPAWVQQGVEEYQKRLTRDLGLNIIEVPLSKRSKSQSIEQSIKNEGAALLKKVPPESYLVALDIRGRLITTEQLAGRLDSFRTQSQNLSLLIGGPDGLASSCLERVDESWSLSGLTLPHPLVRVLVTEQLYRAVSILNGHPYHRG
ncbi:MAG TPA: 23S rRNA (pseudouridine(1915)-N(3))-methyltransferase RlmH [Gammaproteobacteria bacterium]|jgi:23S rRNA (pseudouridine1915-N3)-methyltransferase|nr:23S rRNA (pseudouridine(1915)-N(3))-methyltransferase RlmH [Gammaproteobacteria bacterium]MDP6732745.1 23S rRNA (pseudouridine(1915)-N(3))-methyltransferase RlmH [Gammaproteobacteria bacterium]HAJ74863.1 23S rRNA (pseudouridine(1915)-N(3))-methyltransferase RlmH [Gammaproteobacteria bacterium]